MLARGQLLLHVFERYALRLLIRQKHTTNCNTIMAAKNANRMDFDFAARNGKISEISAFIIQCAESCTLHSRRSELVMLRSRKLVDI